MSARAAALLLGAPLALAACATRQLPPRLATDEPGWEERTGGELVWTRGDVRVTAFRDDWHPPYAFCGRLEHTGRDPLRVTIRAAGIDVPDGAPIGETWADDGASLPYFADGAAFEVGAEPLRFRLRRTVAAGGPPPFEGDELPVTRTTSSGIQITSWPGHTRVGDEANYDLEIRGPGGTTTCRWRTRVVPGPQVARPPDLPLWTLPIAIALAPIGIPLLLLGAGH